MAEQKKDEDKQQQPQQQQNALAIGEKTIADSVLNKIAQFEKAGVVHLPDGYSAANALKFAWLQLSQALDKNDKPVLQVCTKESVAEALLDMAVQGLNPMKKQCYFIAYGKTLTMQRSYQGSIAVAKRVAGVKQVVAHAIYQGDIFEYNVDATTGVMSLSKHEQKMENIDINKLRGAYAIVQLNDGTSHLFVMNMVQIRKAWDMGKGGGDTKAHRNFPDEMACKTVIGRACKFFINNSDDSALFQNEDETPKTVDAEVTVIEDIKTNANLQELAIEPVVQPAAEPVAENTNAADGKGGKPNNQSQEILDFP